MSLLSPIPFDKPYVSVVMPAYNEGATIHLCIARVLAQPQVAALIVVDDASQDNTSEVLRQVAEREPRVRVARHEVNQGKGAALRTGFALCQQPVVIIQDADLEYDPADYKLVLAPIESLHAAVVYGSRFVGGGSHRVLYFWHSIGNSLLTLLSNAFTDLNLSDMETGMKVFRLEVLQQIHIEESRFGFEPEITAKVSRLGVPVYEVPISYHGRTYAEGKKIGLPDAVRALWCILKYRFARM
jgi:glycosyltransferase involved in cell wall biosynthesis